MSYKHQSTVSPFKKIRRARGLTMQAVSVLSGVSYPILVRIDRLEPGKIDNVRVINLMRVAMMLECAPTDLVPFLKTVCKPSKSMKESARQVARNSSPRQE